MAQSREVRLLSEAHRARNSGRERVAIRLYRRILVENPRNFEVALRVAPMLAWAGQAFEAWQLYRRVAREFARTKQFSECLAVYREACRFVPHEFDAWRLCAELQLKMNRADGAFETLVEGRMHFGGPQTGAEAIALLTRAREIEPLDEHVLLDLAHLYAANDQPDVSLELLRGLAPRVFGRTLRRVRWLQWRITFSFRYAYLWLKALGHEGGHAPTLTLDHVREDPRGSAEVRPLRRVEGGSP